MERKLWRSRGLQVPLVRFQFQKKKKNPLGMVKSENYFFLVAHSTQLGLEAGPHQVRFMFGLKHCCWGQSATLSLLSIDQRKEDTRTITLTHRTKREHREFDNAYNLAFAAFTSGLFSAVSMAKPGPKPVSDLTLVEAGSGRLH